MEYYRGHFMSILGDRVIHRLIYMDTYMTYGARTAIGQLKVSSHWLDIEVRGEAYISREE